MPDLVQVGYARCQDRSPMTTRAGSYTPLAAKIGEPLLFIRVPPDLIAYMWRQYEGYQQWEIYYHLVEVMPEAVVRVHKIHGDKLTLLRRFIEDLTGHYSIETLEDWAEAAEALPAIYRKKSLKLMRGPLDRLWVCAESYSWPA